MTASIARLPRYLKHESESDRDEETLLSQLRMLNIVFTSLNLDVTVPLANSLPTKHLWSPFFKIILAAA